MADAAGRGVNQRHLPGLDPGAARDQQLDGATLEQQGGGGAIIDRVGQLEELFRGQVAFAGISAARRAEGTDTLPHRKAGHALPDRCEHAGRLTAEATGQLDRVEAATVIGVDEVEADRGVAHADLAGTRGRQVDIVPLDHFGTAGPFDSSNARHIDLLHAPIRQAGFGLQPITPNAYIPRIPNKPCRRLRMRSYLNQYIDGQWVASEGGKRHELIDPSTEQPCTEITLGSLVFIDLLVVAARKAFDSWTQSSVADRVALLERIIEGDKARIPDLAAAVSEEMGAPIGLAMAAQAPAGLGHFIGTLKAVQDFTVEERVGKP